MKRLLITLTALVCAYVPHAQNTNPWPATGSIGIGTTTPATLLDVKGNGLRVTAGSVGIGTTAPLSLLHINAATTVAPMITLSGADIAHPFTTLAASNVGAKVYSQVTGGLIEQGFTEDDNSAVRIQAHVGAAAPTKGAILLEAFKTTGTGIDAQPIQLITSNQGRIFISATGNVGIGTDKITDAYKLSVEGNVRARKVKVDAAVWADYVFDADYRLPPLAEVEKYINTHKHLPEVPSAAEVKKNGVDLGDNQAMLLKKIEELTLYVIALNKRIAKMEKQKNAVKKIKNK